jgi:ketosteroid isomerase-like protein
MSQENLEIARRWLDALAARSVPEELLAPDFVMENVSTAVTHRTYSGAAGVEEWLSDFFDVLDPTDARYEAEFTNDGANYVVAKILIAGRGRVSGVPMEMPHWGVLWIRNGKITRAVGFATQREALKAVGLSE